MQDYRSETAVEIELITIGAQRAWRESIIENLEIRFGEISELTLAVIEQLESTDKMKLLHAQALRVDSIEEFNSVLAEFVRNENASIKYLAKEVVRRSRPNRFSVPKSD